MRTREDYENWEKRFLAPWAMKSADSQGREFPEEEHPYRTGFQRDRDRIIHSNAFRRLEYKTQVFVYHEGDHFRTRLTHSIEGAQIARTVARTLRLNEDLSEAIILAHDLGHTPFGHSGETALNQLMKDHGGFEHNRQSLRIVTLLEERYPGHPGLNLTFEVREGLDKHRTPYDQPEGPVPPGQKGSPTLEAQIANVADEIAYISHDLDDGLRSGLIRLSQLQETALWSEHFRKGRAADEKILVRETVRAIINAYVTDLVTQTGENIRSLRIQDVSGVRSASAPLATLSPPFLSKNKELKGFLEEKMYRHYHVERMADKSRRILEALFRTYLQNPKILPPELLEKAKKEGLERTISDYIAGMTDRFALDEYNKLFDPHEKV